MNKFLRFVKDESGATAIEYGLIAAAMGLALVTAMPILASAVTGRKPISRLKSTGHWPVDFLFDAGL